MRHPSLEPWAVETNHRLLIKPLVTHLDSPQQGLVLSWHELGRSYTTLMGTTDVWMLCWTFHDDASTILAWAHGKWLYVSNAKATTCDSCQSWPVYLVVGKSIAWGHCSWPLLKIWQHLTVHSPLQGYWCCLTTVDIFQGMVLLFQYNLLI